MQSSLRRTRPVHAHPGRMSRRSPSQLRRAMDHFLCFSSTRISRGTHVAEAVFSSVRLRLSGHEGGDREQRGQAEEAPLSRPAPHHARAAQPARGQLHGGGQGGPGRAAGPLPRLRMGLRAAEAPGALPPPAHAQLAAGGHLRSGRIQLQLQSFACRGSVILTRLCRSCWKHERGRRPLERIVAPAWRSSRRRSTSSSPRSRRSGNERTSLR